VVWNRTLAARHARYAIEGKSTSYAQTDTALTGLKKTPGFAWLNEVSSVPLQQTLRHQHNAYQAFFAKRARYPRFKNRNGKQSASYTRSAFRMKAGALWLAKTSEPLRFVWSWPDIDVTTLDPSMVTVSRCPDGRWFVTFAVDVDMPAQPTETGDRVGIDLGLKDFVVLEASGWKGLAGTAIISSSTTNVTVLIPPAIEPGAPPMNINPSVASKVGGFVWPTSTTWKPVSDISSRRVNPWMTRGYACCVPRKTYTTLLRSSRTYCQRPSLDT
jgi:hypothetical protein